jgi:hypothetical protein
MPHHESADQEPQRRQNPSPMSPAAEDRGGDAELLRLRNREREIMELLGSASPDRILHDLRNVMNEVSLLRTLLETDDQKH